MHFLYSPISILAQSDTIHVKLSDDFPGMDKLFKEDSVLVCTLKIDLKKYQREKYNSKYQKAYFIYYNNDSLISKKVRVKSRGVIRKKLCAIPPIRLNIQKVSKDNKFAHGSSKIKIVTHCNYNREYISYVLKEYLTYKIYNIISPNSFKVRLLQISYIDTGRKNKIYTTWAFMIEPIQKLAERLNCVPISMDNLGIFYTDSSATDLLSMWSYMIGNTDWSIVGRHNIKIIKSKDFSKPAPIAIPYDFDYIGLVNTDYAIPGEGLGINNVQERLFIGPCRKLRDYQIASQHILNKKQEIEELILNFEYLDRSEKTEMLDYLSGFYNSIQRSNFIKYHIDTDCRQSSSKETND